MKCILFDHDGTLMDSMKSVAEATNQTLLHFGFPAQKADHILKDLSARTHSRVSRLTGVTDHKKVSEITAHFYRTHTELSKELTRPFPGIEAMLEYLHKEGIPMGIVSNCRGDVFREIVTANTLDHLFLVMLGEEDFMKHKPAPRGLLMGAELMGYEVQDCLYIGDGMPDYQAARAAGMKIGMVSWGQLGREDLKGLSPDYVFHSPGEISGLFQSIRK